MMQREMRVKATFLVGGALLIGVTLVLIKVLGEPSMLGHPDALSVIGMHEVDRQAGAPDQATLPPHAADGDLGSNRSNAVGSTAATDEVADLPAQLSSTEAEELLWQETYRNASIIDLEADRDNLVRYIALTTNDDFNRMFNSGQYIRLREGDTAVMSDMDESTLSRVQINKDVHPPEIRRATLPEDQYPRLYESWRQMKWLDREARARREVAKDQAAARALLLYSEGGDQR